MKKIIFVLLLTILLPLTSSASFDTNLKYGSKGDAVIDLQDFLQDQGYLSGKIDGRFGLGTRKAVIAFQTANKLKGDGFFGLASRIKAKSMLETILGPSEKAEKEETGTVIATKPLFDVCKNIEGIQTLAPLGMYADNGNCSMIYITPIHTAQAPADTQKPRVYLNKMMDSWNDKLRYYNTEDQAWHNREGFKGTMGLWISGSMFEDPEPSSGIAKIEYYLDQTLIFSYSEPTTKAYGDNYTSPWDTTQYSDGTHTLTLKVYDKAGNVESQSREISIKNN